MIMYLIHSISHNIAILHSIFFWLVFFVSVYQLNAHEEKPDVFHRFLFFIAFLIINKIILFGHESLRNIEFGYVG